MLVFCILRVHERGTFMPNSRVFIFLMLHGLYRMICKNSKSFFCKNSLNVQIVKPLSKIFFQHSWLFYAFLVRMTFIYSSYIPGIKNLSGLNDLNGLSDLKGLNDLCSLISSKNLNFKVKMHIFDGLLHFIT